jgi:hypothetical protein
MEQQQSLPILENNFRYFKDKTPKYKPVEDGFITTSGNPQLGIKYGNTNTNSTNIYSTYNLQKNK